MHHVSRVNQSQAYFAVDRSGDVTIVDLNLIKLNGALIKFYGALLLQDEFLLIVQNLFWNGPACPRVTVPLCVHSPHGQNALVTFEGTLSLQKRGPVRTIVDINQRIALVNDLSFFVVHCGDYSVDLAGDGRCVDWRDRANRIEIDSDIAFLGARSHHRCRAAASSWRASVAG